MQVKFSVIVPIYNGSNHLNQCVQSVISQEYDNYELLLIDDGSTDETIEKCKEYEKIYKDNIRAIHQENAGPSIARKMGLTNSTGNYILFLDVDDSLDHNCLQCLSETIAQNPEIDIFQFAYKQTETGRGTVIYKPCKMDAPQCGISYYIHKKTTNYLWDKAFKRELLENVTFYNLYYSEDAIVLLQSFSFAKSVLTIQDVLYVHTVSPDSLTKKTYSIRKLDQVQAGIYMCEFLKTNHKQYLYWGQSYLCGVTAHNCIMLSKYERDKTQEQQTLNELFNENYKPIDFFRLLLNRKMPLKRYLFLFAFKILPLHFLERML